MKVRPTVPCFLQLQAYLGYGGAVSTRRFGRWKAGEVGGWFEIL
jgi:hypothetical protein